MVWFNNREPCLVEKKLHRVALYFSLYLHLFLHSGIELWIEFCAFDLYLKVHKSFWSFFSLLNTQSKLGLMMRANWNQLVLFVISSPSMSGNLYYLPLVIHSKRSEEIRFQSYKYVFMFWSFIKLHFMIFFSFQIIHNFYYYFILKCY